MNRDVHVACEAKDDDPPHVMSRFCWCNPITMVEGGWLRVVHREQEQEK